jgi:hypothetical protein
MSAFGQTEVTIGQLKYVLNGTEAYVSGYVGSPTDVVIPATIESDGLTFKVTRVNGGAFRDCTTITSVKAVGSNLNEIGYSGNSYGAFQGCTSLASVSFPYVKIINVGSFKYCSNLQSVWLGYSLTNLNGGSVSYDGVFYNCTMLSYIIIPASCTPNSRYTFSGCSRLQAIIYLGTQTDKCGSNADVYNVNNMLNWSESSFTYSGKSPQPTFTTNLPAGFQPTSNAAQGNLEKNVGTYETTVPVTFRNTEMEFTANIPYTYTITPATLTARVKPATKMYGEANPPFQSEYSGFVGGEGSSVISNHGTYSTNATTKSSVGSYAVTQSGASATNYTFKYESGTLTVTKAPLRMEVRDKKMEYGDPIPGFDVDYYGLVNSEAKPEWITTPSVTTSATSKSDAGTYPITINGGEAKNYDVKFKDGTLTINKAILTATTKDASRIYGEKNPDFELKYEGLKNNETAPAWAKAPTFATPATETSPVGKYDITATGEAKNYVLQFVNTGKLSVTKAPLKATARSYTKKQFDNNPKFVVDYEGFKNGETKLALTEEPIATTTATLNSKPGTYPITLSGGIAMNYEFTYVSGILTIIPRDDPDPNANVLTIDNLVGNKGSQCILPIAMKNEKKITGVQIDLYLPQGVTIAKDGKGKMLIYTTNRMAGNYSVTSNQMNGFVRILGYSTDGDAFTGNSGDILNVTLDVSSSMVDGDYDIKLKDIVLSDVNNTEYHPEDVDATLTVKNYKIGDVDNSGAININDVVCIINYILGKQVGTFIVEAADVDGSGKVNINDVVTLINRYILKRTNVRAKTTENVTRGVEDNNYLHLNQIDIKPGETKEVELLMKNSGTVAAAQGNIKLPEGLSFVTKSNGRVDASNVDTRAEGYTLSCAIQDDGSMTFAHYSPDGYTYDGKSGGIFKFKIQAADDAKSGSYEVKMSEVVLSVDGVGVEIPNRTSVLNVEGGSNDETIFDVGDLTSLVNYIMNRQGSVFNQQYDLNNDGEFNIGDIILMIKMIHQSNAARVTMAKARTVNGLTTDVDLSKFTAAQMIVSVGEQAKVASIRLKGKNKETHRLSYEPMGNGLFSIVIYSQTNQLLNVEEDGLLEVEFANGSSEVAISDVILSTPASDCVWIDSLPVGATTGICLPTATEAYDIYDLNGRKELKDGLRKGIYIMNGKKTVVR